MTNPGGILSDLFVHLSLVICHFRVWGLEAFETCALSVEWSNDFAVVVGISLPDRRQDVLFHHGDTGREKKW